MDRMLSILLLPVLVVQGLWVVVRTPRLPEAEGPRAGVGDGPRVLIVGDSSAAGVGVATQAQALAGHVSAQSGASWVLVARSGATTRDVIAMLQDVPPEPFDVAVVALGVNDCKNGVPLARWLQRTAALYDLLRARYGVSSIVVSALPPMGLFPALPHPLRWVLGRRAARFDAALEALVARRSDAVLVRPDLPMETGLMAPDGFHPGPQVYARWGQDVARAIADVMQRRR